MVRSVSRSRGCSQCLKRKIKCDEISPACTQCKRIKKPCPGVYDGLFIVNTSPKGWHTKQTPQFGPPSHEITSIPPAPPQRPLFEHVLVSNFIESFSLSTSGTVNLDSWTRHLFSRISSSTSLGLSIRATTLAFHAQKTNKTPLRWKAGQYYAYALRGQQASISQHLQRLRDKNEVPTEETIFLSFMLMYYEMIQPTSIGSWVTHLRGLIELFLLRGPENCQVGATHLIFRSTRLLEAYLSFRNQVVSCFATPIWRHVPFSRSKKTDSDTLVDSLHAVSSSLWAANTAKQQGSTTMLQDTNEINAQALIGHPGQSEYSYTQSQAGIPLPTVVSQEHLFPFDLERIESANTETWLSGGDFCSTISPSMYDAIWIIIHHLRHLREPNSLNASASMVRCSLLLGFAHELFRRNLHCEINSGSCMQIVFPLEVVSWYSPCVNQQARAKSYLHRIGWVELPGL